jgi:hypothetical protein
MAEHGTISKLSEGVEMVLQGLDYVPRVSRAVE